MNENNDALKLIDLQPSENVRLAIGGLWDSINLLVGQYKNVKTRLQEIESAVIDFNPENERLNAELEELTRTLENYKNNSEEHNLIVEKLQSEINFLKVAEDENTELKEEITKLKNQHHILITQMSESSDNDEKIKYLQEEIDKLNNEKSELALQFQTIKESETEAGLLLIQEKDDKIGNLISENESLNFQIIELNQKVNELEKIVAEKEEQINLTAQPLVEDFDSSVLVAEIEEKDIKINLLNEEIERLQVQLSNLTAQMEETDAESENSEAKQDEELQRKFDELSNHVHLLQADLTAKNEEITDYKIELDLKRSINEQLTAELDSLNADTLKIRELHEADIDVLKEDLQSLRDENQRYLLDIAKLKDRGSQGSLFLDEPDSMSKELHLEISKIKAELLSAESINIELKDTLQNQKADFEAKLSSFERDKIGITLELQDLRNSLDFQTQFSENLQHEKNELLESKGNSEQSTKLENELLDKIKVLEERNREYSQRIEEFSVQTEIMMADSDQLNKIQKEVEDLRENNRWLSENNAQLSSENNILVKTLKESKNASLPAEEDLILMEQVKMDMMKEMKDLRGLISEKEILLDDAKKLNFELEKSITNLQSMVSKKDERITELIQFESEFRMNQKEIIELKSNLNNINMQVSKANQDLINQDSKIFSLIVEKNTAQGIVEELTTSVSKLEKQVNEKDEQLTSTAEQINQMRSEENLRLEEKAKISDLVKRQIAKMEDVLRNP